MPFFVGSSCSEGQLSGFLFFARRHHGMERTAVHVQDSTINMVIKMTKLLIIFWVI